MELDMPVADIVRDVKNNVVMYKGKPVFVMNVNDDGNVMFMDLETQTIKNAEFDTVNFRSPNMRLGFINVAGGSVYTFRNPIRKFYYGYSKYNVEYVTLAATYPAGKRETHAMAMCLHSKEMYQTLVGFYPTLKEAIKQCQASKGSCAFDRQFAVADGGFVFYKTRKVGKWDANTRKTEDIVWNEGFEHLNILLDNNHEKTLRDIGSSSY